MSFDVFLKRFADGESAQVDRQPVREVLLGAKHHGPDDYGFYVVSFPDGVEVEFSAEGLESRESFSECAFHIRGFSDYLMKFIFDIARAGDMAIIPVMEGNPFVLVSEQQKTTLPVDIQEEFQLIVVDSAGELGAVLSGGFEGWSAYRDQVLRQARPEGES
jgi:hypothetical protein